MKRFIAAGVLLVLVLSISISGSYYVRFHGSVLERRLDDIIVSINAKNYEAAFGESTELIEYWEGAEDVLAIFVNNSYVNRIGVEVQKLPSLCISEERGNILAECESIRYLISHVSEDERLNTFSVL